MAEKEWLVIVDGANAWRVKAERYNLSKYDEGGFRVDFMDKSAAFIASFTGNAIHVIDTAQIVDPPKVPPAPEKIKVN